METTDNIYSTNFRDYDGDHSQLLGKLVLHEGGSSICGTTRSIHKIEKVLKNGFKITGMTDEIFGFIDGHQRGLNGRINMTKVSRCKLILPEEADDLRTEWKKKKEIKAIKADIQSKLDSLSLEQLQKISQIIK
jgi:hypothetical protein